MKVDRDARGFVAAAAVPALLAAALGHRRSAALLTALPLAIAAFFRDPDRSVDRGMAPDPDAIVAPADGKVMHVGEPQQGVAPAGDWQQISIFLALSDVHINRTPMAGRVRSVVHKPGRFRAAFKAESAHQNERTEIVIDAERWGVPRTLVFRQIVGMAARRVVTRVEAGEVLAAGQRVGLMRFGSRMDVFVPPEVAIVVEVGQHTVGGETVIARWPSVDLDRSADA